MLRQLFTRPTKRAIQAGGTVLLAGAMVCGSVPAYATGHLKPHEVTPIVQPDEPAVTCNDRAEYEYYRNDGELGRRVIFNWAQCVGLISEYQKHQMVKKDSVISRGQFVEYLYRLSGSPEVKNLPAQSPYGDIKTDDPRFPVVMWARERGITWGWSDGNFHYDTPASESSTALMAYRLAGSPKVTVAAYDPQKYFPPTPWKEKWPNMPYNSELHKAYTWLHYGLQNPNNEDSIENVSYRRYGIVSPNDEFEWLAYATYEQAIEVIRLADKSFKFK